MPSPRVALVVNGRRHRLVRQKLTGGYAQSFWPSPLARHLGAGGWVIAQLEAVHAHKCRTGKWDKKRERWSPCTCGADDLLKAFVKPPAKVRKRHRAAQWPDHKALLTQARKRGKR